MFVDVIGGIMQSFQIVRVKVKKSLIIAGENAIGGNREYSSSLSAKARKANF
jgi:hypothetical protein